MIKYFKIYIEVYYVIIEVCLQIMFVLVVESFMHVLRDCDDVKCFWDRYY